VDIRIHIERLVIEGLPVPPSQRPLIQAALEAELAGRLTALGPGPGLLADGAISRLAAGTMHLPAQPGAAALGRQIAGAIHAGLARD
jgi:hypothetical protein